MATITTRSGKGSPLTNNEVDSNFTNLNTDKQEVLSEGSFANGDKTKLDGIATNAIDGVEIQDEGSALSTVATKLNFVGSGVIASGTGATKTISIPGASAGVAVQDEGSTLTTNASTLNFVGSGVTASGTGVTKTITISGGGSSGMSDLIDDTSPQLGGQLDLNGNSITTNSGFLLETTNAAKSLEFSVQGQTNFKVTPTGVELSDSTDIAYFGGDGTSGGVTLRNGYIDIKGKSVSEATYINFYCESSNAHAVKLQAPAHADFSGNITSTLPNTTGTLVTSNAQRRIEVVSALPSSPDSNTIYFVT